MATTQLSAPITLLNAVVASGAGSSFPVEFPATVVVSGITVATVAVEVSLDNSVFKAYVAALTADGVVLITTPCKYIRANVTAYTSGTITVKILY